MLVQQERGGWIGIVLNGWCANKDEHFNMSSTKSPRKLIPIEETTSTMRIYASILLTGIKRQNYFPEKQNMIDELEEMTNQYRDDFIKELKNRRNGS